MTDAMTELKEHEKRLLAYIVHRSRNPADADDVLQETLLRVFEQTKKRTIENPLAYAFRVADTVIFAQARRFKHETELGDDDFECDTPLADEQLAYKQRVAVLLGAMQTLPPLRRQVFMKRHIDGLSRAEIATDLGLSVEAVKKHLVRAMASMAISVSEARQELSTSE